MSELINEYLNEPETSKPSLEDLLFLSLANVPVKVPKGCSLVKLRPMPQRKVIEILRSNGFEEVRPSKHITFKKKVGGRVLTTWVPTTGK